MPGPLAGGRNTLDGFPAGGFGDRYVSVIDHPGPASYTQVTTGPLAGGDVVTAAEFGLKSFSHVGVMGLSNDGVNEVLACPAVSSKGEITTVTLEWFVAATRAQVAGAVNLTAKTVRLFAIGR